MRWAGATVGAALLAIVAHGPTFQAPAVRALDEKALREYAGVYRWDSNTYLYIQAWAEINPAIQLVAFDESGEVRTLYPTDRDRFFTGPGLGVRTAIESRVEFTRDGDGRIAGLIRQPEGAAPRLARRVDIEKHEDVRFSNGDSHLAGTLIAPAKGTQHPAIVVVHGSGAASREQMLPFARYFVRHGMAVLAYDKRGVGGSTGDWNTASFEDLAGDVVAAFQYLKTRKDIDGRHIGLLGVSQAGWIMPLAAVRAREIAFVINISGAGVPVAETTIDQAQNEMTALGMKPETVARIVALMKLQYQFAQTGNGWDEYANARASLAKGLGRPPDAFPGTPDHPAWRYIRLVYFHDPSPTLRQLQAPTLALFGGLDNNIVAAKNSGAWEAALKAAGNRDYTIITLPKANHMMLEASVGTNAEMASLQRLVPEYFTTVHEWLAKHVRGYGAAR
jgi:pimeloyl-ACP methyl ester carboxylesterase